MLSIIYVFVVDLVFSIALAVFFSRFAFQLVRAPFVNQIAQWVYTTTNPVVRPLERFVPRWRQASFASLLICYVLAFLKVLLLGGLAMLSAAGPILALSAAIGFGLTYWIYAMILYIAMSWLFSLVEARRGNDFVEIVYKLGAPPGQLIKRFIPTRIGPFDFAVALAIVLLVLLNIIQAYSLGALARTVSPELAP